MQTAEKITSKPTAKIGAAFPINLHDTFTLQCLGLVLQKIRQDRGITTRALSQASGFAIHKLQSIEWGEWPVTVEDIGHLLPLLHTDLARLTEHVGYEHNRRRQQHPPF